MIDEKKLISHIENQYRQWGEEYDAQQILGDIEDFTKVGEWIPFNKEEPKEEGLYLCCFDDEFITTVEYENGDWNLWADSGEVIAWKQLPKPYRKEDNK